MPENVVAELVTVVTARESVSSVLARMEGQLDKSAASADRASAAIGRGITEGASKASSGMLQLQAAQARLQAQQGDLAGAAERLRNALSQQNQTTTQTIAVQRQLASTEQAIAAQASRNAAAITQQAAAEQRAAAQQTAAQQRAASAAIARQQALARLQAASGNLVGAERTLSTALSGVERGTRTAIQLETQLAQVRTKLVNSTVESTSGNRNIAGSLLSIAGPLGIATTGLGAFLAVAGRVKDGFQLRATLDEQRRSIGTLLGDVQKGDQVFKEAADFGKKYGFTQKEMGESAAAAAPLIRSSTTATQKQLEVLARLASLNSGEGFTGAVFSTKELASGDVTSIAERFNIAKSAANAMKAEIASGKDVFTVLDAQLTKMGVTVDVLKNRTQGAAGAMRTYEQAQEGLTLAMGGFAEGPGVKVIDFLAKFTTTLTDIASKGDAFATQRASAQGMEASLIAASTSYEDYGVRAAAVNQQIADSFKGAPLGAAIAQQIGGFTQLTPVQYAYTQSLIAQGQSATQAMTAMQALSSATAPLNLLQQQAANTSAEMNTAFLALTPQMLQVASTGPEAANGMLALAQGFLSGAVTADQFRAVLEAQIAATQQQAAAAENAASAEAHRASEHQNGIAATDGSTASLQTNTQALIDQTQKTLESGIQTQQLSNFQATLASLGGAVANGLATSANAAAALASQYNITSAAAANLINLQAQLARSKANAGALADQRAGERSGGTFSSAKAQTAYADSQRTAARASEAAAESEARYQQTLGNSGPALRLARQELAGAVKGSAAFFDAKNKIAQLEKKDAAAAGKKPKAAGAAKLTDQQRLNNQLLADQDAYQDKSEDALRTYNEDVSKINADFARKELAQQQQNNLSKIQSQADFYDRLTSSDLNKNKDKKGKADPESQAALQRVNADYQSDFAKSQELAQSGQAKLAAEYLDLKQKQLEQELSYEERLAKAKADKDAGEVSRLEAIQNLRRQAASEEEKQLLAGGDDNVNDRDQKLAEASQKEQDAQDKIGLASDRATERKIANAERSGKKIDEEQTKLDKLGKTYDGIAARRGDSPAPTSAPAAAGDATSTPAPAAATPSTNPLLDALSALQGAVSAVEKAVRESGRDVAGAVRGAVYGRAVST